MKKYIIGIFLVLIIVSGCKYIFREPEPVLNELQSAACQEAAKAGTCQTRLIEVGVVLPEECCKILSRCC